MLTWREKRVESPQPIKPINPQQKGEFMKIEATVPSIISEQEYRPTLLSNVFVNPETGKVCILDKGMAYEIKAN